MEFVLESSLPHQQRAVDAVAEVFAHVAMTAPPKYYANPCFDRKDARLLDNILRVQRERSVPAKYRGRSQPSKALGLDIKMETGTGKTYVYTKTMYELHRRYGFNKFILVVPSLSIKAGTAQFLLDASVQRHFRDVCGYQAELVPCVLEAQKRAKGRQFFPSVVSEFVKGSCQSSDRIFVLLLNMQLLTGSQMLKRDDYDYGPERFYRPFAALKATRPFVLIDEPHRFQRTQAAYRTIEKELLPQCIIRYGATFPTVVQGRGKKRAEVKDYANLLYDLNACAAFNQNLIKGVIKEHFEAPSGSEEKVKITKIESKKAVRLQDIRREEKRLIKESYTLAAGDALSLVSPAFRGLMVREIKRNTVVFSNGVEKRTGEELDASAYMTSYQEAMLDLALKRHFQVERQNFRRPFKIKPLALFFIDDIAAFRGTESEQPYLREFFERALRRQMEELLRELSPEEDEYRAYLKASLADISGCLGGYFAQDHSESDPEVQREMQEILYGKKELLTIRRPDGSYNVRRFLFSKWTLKEGWDNPNIFTITKLRSSGSEISKLQEVGRGLRLPVDENGNRIAGEAFYLTYIVDFTEADFAEKLVQEINHDVTEVTLVTTAQIVTVAKAYGIQPPELLKAELLRDGFIDLDDRVREERRSELLEKYPEFAAGVERGKILDANHQKPQEVHVRPAPYQELKALWEKLNQRYLFHYDKDIEKELPEALFQLLREHSGIFSGMVLHSERAKIQGDAAQTGRMMVARESGMTVGFAQHLSYGVFLRRLSSATNLPLPLLHDIFVRYAREVAPLGAAAFTEATVQGFLSVFLDWQETHLLSRFHYKQMPRQDKETKLTYADGALKPSLPQADVGIYVEEGLPLAKYLYDVIAYDSPLEKQNILSDIENVSVYGKIPRRSIAIPTLAGMYSPDFMYVVKKKDGTTELNVVIETKDVKKREDLRGDEKVKIRCAERFFESLKEDGFAVKFRTQIRHEEMKNILDELME